MRCCAICRVLNIPKGRPAMKARNLLLALMICGATGAIAQSPFLVTPKEVKISVEEGPGNNNKIILSFSGRHEAIKINPCTDIPVFGSRGCSLNEVNEAVKTLQAALDAQHDPIAVNLIKCE